MKLLSLKLQNFKGVRLFNLETFGGNFKVYGDNATGKTTIFDAVTWLLFNKNSQNKSDFGIKTYNVSGNAIHRLEHTVEAVFSLNEETICLKKIYKEKWTMTRGSATERFDGHETIHYIDDVPVQKNKYEKYIKEIVDEDVFKLLTNPLFFNENLKWQERREMILRVCGDVTMEEVLTSNPDLGELAKLIGKKSIDDLKTIISVRKKKINDELKIIPAKISELQNSLGDNCGDTIKIEAELGCIRQKIEIKSQEIALVKNGGAIAQLKIKAQEIESQIMGRLNVLNAGTSKKLEDAMKAKNVASASVSKTMSEITINKSTKAALETTVAQCNRKREALVKEFTEESSKQFPNQHHEDTCVLCGQKLPESSLEELRAKEKKAREAFNIRRSERLSEINRQGKENKEALEAAQESLNSLNDQLTLLDSNLIAERDNLQQQTDALSNLEGKVVTTSPAIEALRRQKEELLTKAADIQQAEADNIAALEVQRNNLYAEVSAAERKLAAIHTNEKTRLRIKELENQQTTIAREYEELNRQTYLIETFIKTKIDILQDKINSKFLTVRFNMFKKNITNEGIEECCETTFDGVPYQDLNNAAKINAGLDIIRTLSEYYKFTAPIFIDNAEAITRFLGMDAQIVKLIVSEQDKALRVELNQSELKEVI